VGSWRPYLPRFFLYAASYAPLHAKKSDSAHGLPAEVATTPDMTDADRAFYQPWWDRILASYGKSKRVRDRIYYAFIEAAHAREAAQRAAQAEAELTCKRAANAARMRAYRARRAAMRKETPRWPRTETSVRVALADPKNGQLANGGEGFVSKANVLRSLKAVRKAVAKAGDPEEVEG
jgi:hypothetical protein